MSTPTVIVQTGALHAGHASSACAGLSINRSGYQAGREFAKPGYQVQTIRTAEAEALAFLKVLDDLSANENFILSVGPGLQPVFGQKPGDQTDFHSQYFFNTTLHALPQRQQPGVGSVRDRSRSHRDVLHDGPFAIAADYFKLQP